MNLESNNFYHIYNRGINSENIFRNEENYKFFLKKFRHHLDEHLEVIAYCLMPNHFHFLVKVVSADTKLVKKKLGIVLGSYAQAFNKMFRRTGSLFQKKTKAKLVQDSNYFLTLVVYIHQNPIRANLVENQEDWHYSSFRDFAGFRNGTLPKKELIYSKFSNENQAEQFYTFSQNLVKNVDLNF